MQLIFYEASVNKHARKALNIKLRFIPIVVNSQNENLYHKKYWNYQFQWGKITCGYRYVTTKYFQTHKQHLMNVIYNLQYNIQRATEILSNHLLERIFNIQYLKCSP